MKKVVGLQHFKWSNNLKSILLLILFPILLILIWFLIVSMFAIVSGDATIGFSDVISIVTVFSPFIVIGTGVWFMIAWIFHTKMITAMTHAKPITRKQFPALYNIVENLAISRGIPTPKIYIIDDPSLNAYSSGLGYKDAHIAFSRGLLEKLNEKEIEAVAGHELTHIINRDTRLMIIAIIFVGIIQTLASIVLRVRVRGNRKSDNRAALLVFILQIAIYVIGMIVSLVVQRAISRKREFLADAGAVELTKESQYMISALQKISQDPVIEAVKNPSVAQLFIQHPVSSGKKQSFVQKLFATHPPISERIEALKMIG